MIMSEISTFTNQDTNSSGSQGRKQTKMASPTARIMFRVIIVSLTLLFIFYLGRPLYWKISATVHEIRENRQTVKQGLSQIVLDAQKSVGWYHDESDSGAGQDRVGKKVSATRRLLFSQVS